MENVTSLQIVKVSTNEALNPEEEQCWEEYIAAINDYFKAQVTTDGEWKVRASAKCAKLSSKLKEYEAKKKMEKKGELN